VAKAKFVPKSLRKTTDPVLPPLDAPLQDGDESYVAAQTRRMRAAADKEEADSNIRKLELGKARGDLVQLKDVRLKIEIVHRKWVDALEVLPSNVLRSLGPVGMDLKDKVRTSIEEELNKLREGLADAAIQRKR
jgi:hypothetical protein